VGNYYADVVRLCVRFLLPLCLVWTLLLTWQGVPSTLAAGPQATPIDAGAGMAEDPAGPGRGDGRGQAAGRQWRRLVRPEQRFPLENPTPLSNALEIVGILLIPMAVIFMIGSFTGRRASARWCSAACCMSLLSPARDVAKATAPAPPARC
jgi:K+-transporting ATPase ATPase A chain